MSSLRAQLGEVRGLHASLSSLPAWPDAVRPLLMRLQQCKDLLDSGESVEHLLKGMRDEIRRVLEQGQIMSEQLLQRLKTAREVLYREKRDGPTIRVPFFGMTTERRAKIRIEGRAKQVSLGSIALLPEDAA